MFPLFGTRSTRQDTTQRSRTDRPMSKEGDTAQTIYHSTAVRKEFEAMVVSELGDCGRCAHESMRDTFDKSATGDLAKWRLAVLKEIQVFMDEDNSRPMAGRYRKVFADGDVDIAYLRQPTLDKIFSRTGLSGGDSADRSLSEVLDETQGLLESMAEKRREWDAISALNPASRPSTSEWPFILFCSGVIASAFLLPAGARYATRGLRTFLAGKEEARALKSLGRSLAG